MNPKLLHIPDRQPGSYVFGIQKVPAQILGVPAGAKIRLRLRPLELARVFIRHHGDTTRWFVTWSRGGNWQLADLTGVNATAS
jgi:hypothetical protein